MTAPIPVSKRWLTLLWVLVMTLGAYAQEPVPAPVPPTPPVPPPVSPSIPTPAPATPIAPAAANTAVPGTLAGIVPGDFLDSVGQKVKARWRQLYRQGPPPPSSDRLRVAFTLGELVAESYLAVQAGDAQQFRNNNQEVLKLCGVLGLADKIGSDVNAGSKMAASEDWPALRKHVLQTQLHIETVLNDQRDEDLAILMDIGLWIRLFDISTSLVVTDPAVQQKTICIGSLAMLEELVSRYDHLSDPARENEVIAMIGGVLEYLQRHWTAAGSTPTQEEVQLTFEKLKFLILKVEGK